MNCDRKEIDQLVCVVSEQMRAHDLIALLIDQNLETGLRLADSPRRIPALRLIERPPESNSSSKVGFWFRCILAGTPSPGKVHSGLGRTNGIAKHFAREMLSRYAGTPIVDIPLRNV